MSRALRALIFVVAVSALSAVVAGGVAAEPAGSGPGNAPNAKACQKGGWQGLVRSDGSGFDSERACTSYAAKGGTLFNANEAPCLNGGYRNYVTSSGASFASQSDCVSYIRSGGMLVAASVVAPCLNGGWQNYVRSDSSAFSDEANCRSYAAGGGQLAPLTYKQQFQDMCTDAGGTFAEGTRQGFPGYQCTKYDGVGLTSSTRSSLIQICQSAGGQNQSYLFDASFHNYYPNFASVECQGPQSP